MKNEEAVDLMKNLIHNLETYYGLSKQGRTAFRMAITALEERKRGKWIHGRCSECGEHAPYWPMASTYHTTPYCYACGAKMDGKETEDDKSRMDK